MTQNDAVVLVIFVGGWCFFWGFVAGYVSKSWSGDWDSSDAIGGLAMLYGLLWLPLTIGFIAGLWHLLTN